MLRDAAGLLSGAPPMRGYGVSVTPGRDGPLVFVAGYGEPNRLYTRRNGRFVDTACGIVADGDRHGMGVCAADVDADGCEEVYVHNCASYAGLTGDTDLLLDRLEAERYRWTDAFALEVNADRLNFRAGRSVAVLDRFGTGRYGIAVASYGAPVAYYELGEDGEVTDMAESVGLDVNGGCRSLLPGPIVGDGMDLFVGVEDGPNRLFRNERGHYVPADAGPALADPAGDARGVALVDEGREGFSIALGNWEGESRLLRPSREGVGSGNGGGLGRDGDGGAGGDAAENAAGPETPTYHDVAPKTLASAGSVRSVVAADLDNDGRQELFCNALGEPNRLFAQETSSDPEPQVPQVPQSDADDGPRWNRLDAGDAAEPDGFGTGAVAADLDGDGALELLVVHGEVAAQPITVYEVPGAAANGWLRVAPTTRYGAPARGAVVRLETDRGRQRRVIDAGSGYLCQTEPVAHFGLGGATPERLVVRWPEGREHVIEAPAAETVHEVAHPAAEDE